MIEFFSNWAEGIIIISIIGVIIEMILPEGNNKKYVKMVIGVCVLFSIINPILSRFNKNVQIDSNLYEKYFETQTSSNIVTKDTNINKIYETNIKNSIKTELLKIGYSADNIEIKIDEKNAEKIEYIKMRIKRKSKIEKVNKVEIGNKEEKTDNDTNSEDVNKIRDFININYGIEKDKIFIE